MKYIVVWQELEVKNKAVGCFYQFPYLAVFITAISIMTYMFNTFIVLF